MIYPRTKYSNGSAILVVLALIAVSTFLIGYLLKFSLRKYTLRHEENNRTVALYIAEAGISHAIYQDRYKEIDPLEIKTLDSVQKFRYTTFSNNSEMDQPGFDLDDSENNIQETDFKYFLNPLHPKPKIETTFNGEYLRVVSTGMYRKAEVIVEANIGKAPSDSIFASALVLTGRLAPIDLTSENVKGIVRLKNEPDASLMELYPLSGKFNIQTLISGYVRERSDFYSILLKNKLSEEGGELGNGVFDNFHRPKFQENQELFFPLGDLTFEGLGNDCLQIKGPGRLFAHGDVYIKGCVQFADVKILAGRSIHVEGKVSCDNLTLYSGKNIYLKSEELCDVNAIAEESVILEQESQTSLTSVIISVGIQAKQKKLEGVTPEGAIDPLDHGVYAKDNSILRGVIIAAGTKGTIMLENTEQPAEGIFISGEKTWIAGNLKGSVITSTLRCNSKPEDNCLGDGIINREELSPLLTLPLDFGSNNNSNKYKISRWKVR